MPRHVVYKPKEKLKEISKVILPPKFMPSFYEWLSVKGKFITGFKSIENNDIILYTVPANKVFYLTFVSMAAGNTGAISLPTIDFEVDNVPTLTVQSGTAATGVGNTSLSFVPPIKLSSTRTLKVRSNKANCWVRCCYGGFEIDVKDILII